VTSQLNQPAQDQERHFRIGEDDHPEQHLRPSPCSPADESPVVYVPEFGSGNVLATAAKFEKGEFV
jgi:hypothetical protein